MPMRMNHRGKGVHSPNLMHNEIVDEYCVAIQSVLRKQKRKVSDFQPDEDIGPCLDGF